MANIKELLGSDYKEGMSLEDVDKALSNKKLVDLSTGDYVAKAKYDTLETKHKNLQAEFDQVKEQTKDYDKLKSENETFKSERASADLKKKLTDNGINEKYFNYVKLDIDGKKLEIGDDEKVNKANVEKYLKEHPEFASKPVVSTNHKEVTITTGGSGQQGKAEQSEAERNATVNANFREFLGIGKSN